MFAVAAVALLAGLLGGLTGIGGVIVVPALTEFGALPVDRAIGTAMFAFVLAGPIAARLALRRLALPWPPVLALCAAAAAGALLGAFTLHALPGWAVRLFVAGAAIASGLHTLVGAGRRVPRSDLPGSAVLAALGLVVGWGSAVSGTGGPVMLIPLLLVLRVPAAVAVALGLAAHLPIVGAATLVNAAAGRIDFALGAMLGALLAAGTLGGLWLSARLSARQLTTGVAVALVAVGAWYARLAFAAA